MRTMTIGLALLGALTLSGCPKGGGSTNYSDEELANNPAANFHKGVGLLQAPDKKTGAVDYQGAYTYFAKSADLGGGPKAAFNAGWTAERLGNLADAENMYRKSYEADPTYEAAASSLARVLVALGKNDDATALFASRAQAAPTDLSARNDYMASLVKGSKYDDAIKEAQQILRKDPKNAETYRNLSALYYAQNNYSMSQLTAEKALELDDSDPGVYNNMGVTYLIQENEPAAIEKFKTAIKLDSGHFEANMNLGFTALNSGDYKLALECFEHATQSNPSSLEAKLGLAVAARGTKDFKRAGEIYDAIIKNDPKTEASYFNAAVLNEFYTKDFTKALKYLQAYIDTHNVGPTHPVFALMQRVNDAKAAEDAKKAAEAERKRLEEERQQRNKELLGSIAARVTKMEGVLTQFAACLDEGSIEEVRMVLEQAMMVVEAEDADMAPDIDQFLGAYEAGVAAATEGCDPGTAAPPSEEAPPAEDGAPPAEGGDAPPAEEVPAEPPAEGGE